MRMRLSQGHLNVLELCPRKFQHTYLDQMSSPTPLDQHTRLIWGNRFHTLMQQRELGLPIDIYLAGNHIESEGGLAVEDDARLLQQVQSLVGNAPELFQSRADAVRQSEHRRSLQVKGYLLTVVYDLLILDRQHAQILDWKTYPRPQDRRWLAHHWQTRLYPFVLAETSTYAAEQISMAYWFVQAKDGEATCPQCLQFHYSADQHEHIRQQLSDQLDLLTTWLTEYERGELFPQIDESLGSCKTCHFAVRCQRGAFHLKSHQESVPPLADIPEVVL